MPYGNFVEIEGEEAVIGQVINLLGLQKARRMSSSYTSLFRFVRRNLGLNFGDLTFDNFQGITVTESDFDEA